MDAVRIEPLARQLKTSKGSFYWHFADRPALLAAMLEMWQREGTSVVIDAVEAAASPEEKLRMVLRLALEPSEAGLDVARTEAALRAWAAEDAEIAPQIAKVDEQRTSYLAHLLDQLGYDKEIAACLGQGLYLGLLGLYSARRYAPALANDRALQVMLEQAIAAAPAGTSDLPD